MSSVFLSPPNHLTSGWMYNCPPKDTCGRIRTIPRVGIQWETKSTILVCGYKDQINPILNPLVSIQGHGFLPPKDSEDGSLTASGEKVYYWRAFCKFRSFYFVTTEKESVLPSPRNHDTSAWIPAGLEIYHVALGNSFNLAVF